MTTDCNICCEVINGRNKLVSCPYCEFGACTRCTERYLTDTHDDAHCMNCRKGWDHSVLSKNMTQKFIKNDYKNHRKEILIDREKSLLPQTQPDVAYELAKREKEKMIKSLEEQKRELQRKIREISGTIDELKYGDDGIVRVKADTITRKCPVGDCRGFLNSAWTCGLCETKICKECNEPEGENHECNPDNVETMKLLKKDSKPCPSCGTLITKIDGCDQMWCTQGSCHTAFSWRTGQKVFGVIHNPHYIQFMQTNGGLGRDPQDIPCGGLPGDYTFFNKVRAFLSREGKNASTMFIGPIQFIRHLTHVEERHYRVNDVVASNRDLRVRYMLKEITEEHFSKMVLQRETSRCKNKGFHDIIVMLMHTGSDIMNLIDSYLSDPLKTREVYKQIGIMNKLKDYANDQFKRLGEIYKCKHPYVDEQWKFIRYT